MINGSSNKISTFEIFSLLFLSVVINPQQFAIHMLSAFHLFKKAKFR